MMNKSNNKFDNLVWYNTEGEVIACNEKLKVMQQNLLELQEVAQAAFEDGILMGIAQEQLQRFLLQLILNLENPYIKK